MKLGRKDIRIQHLRKILALKRMLLLMSLRPLHTIQAHISTYSSSSIELRVQGSMKSATLMLLDLVCLLLYFYIASLWILHIYNHYINSETCHETSSKDFREVVLDIDYLDH